MRKGGGVAAMSSWIGAAMSSWIGAAGGQRLWARMGWGIRLAAGPAYAYHTMPARHCFCTDAANDCHCLVPHVCRSNSPSSCMRGRNNKHVHCRMTMV